MLGGLTFSRVSSILIFPGISASDSMYSSNIFILIFPLVVLQAGWLPGPGANRQVGSGLGLYGAVGWTMMRVQPLGNDDLGLDCRRLMQVSIPWLSNFA